MGAHVCVAHLKALFKTRVSAVDVALEADLMEMFTLCLEYTTHTTPLTNPLKLERTSDVLGEKNLY